ncbi:Lectizyme [Mycolicibacterium brisbanense]|uniref:Lectizyme n=1 Tax=Mycolicibacterium brisbanense TaxID=146020 RepID=A0A100VUN0_9MYCO|nr:Lectizyme [Mycolicibacterium brisbanense]
MTSAALCGWSLTAGLVVGAAAEVLVVGLPLAGVLEEFVQPAAIATVASAAAPVAKVRFMSTTQACTASICPA